MLNSLSGRFLVLTVLFVMLAEILIFVPSVARFREDYLLVRLERAQIASLVLLATDDIDPTLETELLQNAGVFNVVLLRDEVRQLMLSSPIPSPIVATYDLREATALTLIKDAIMCLFSAQKDVIRVIGNPTQDAGLLIEVTMEAYPLRHALLDYGIRVLLLSAVISVVTAGMLFLAVQRFLVGPIKGVVNYIRSYAAAPEDARNIITPHASVRELRQAEEALYSMQTQLTGALRQKERLAQLGGAVAKVSHDLRNILTTAQLFADRMDASEDPVVQRAVPKLVNSIRRAVNLCESTLAFGKAEEPPPTLTRISLATLAEDALDNERIAVSNDDVVFHCDVPNSLILRCDPDQMLRILGNLVGNARQAIVANGDAGVISITAGESDADWWIRVADNGPGLPVKAREHLFTAFQGSFRKGGTGLGLAIASELVRGHGGRLELERSDDAGTIFAIWLPKGQAILDA
ncbi:HAMP domain-containing sensor histidine kinase [Pseudoruegeria sp. SK021]|uniref:sensor histidine kinase n=1 Tax=Pseudoruegeria sp. SK021 TaxID=1933035 RepID=UPI000A218820|nr:HAMP domain-containing sensor histidine kinase [Pseudoruegeria sp. SK021]OSP56611.1 sensor histidine kinase [Pseudoruegeria sp. SK021]